MVEKMQNTYLLIAFLVPILIGCGEEQKEKPEMESNVLEYVRKQEASMGNQIVYIKKMPENIYKNLIEIVKDKNKVSQLLIYASGNTQNKRYTYPNVKVESFDTNTRVANVIIYDPKYKTPILQKWNYSGNTWVQSYHK